LVALYFTVRALTYTYSVLRKYWVIRRLWVKVRFRGSLAKAISCGGNEIQYPISWETSAVLFQDQYTDGHVSEGPGPPQPTSPLCYEEEKRKGAALRTEDTDV